MTKLFILLVWGLQIEQSVAIMNMKKRNSNSIEFAFTSVTCSSVDIPCASYFIGPFGGIRTRVGGVIIRSSLLLANARCRSYG